MSYFTAFDRHAYIFSKILRKEVINTVEISKYLGVTTNNQAEYTALIEGLKKAKDLGAKEVSVFMDSELVVKQLNREYKVKNKDLAPLFLQVYNLSLNFSKISFTHVYREHNSEADKLANEAMDRGK